MVYSVYKRYPIFGGPRLNLCVYCWLRHSRHCVNLFMSLFLSPESVFHLTTAKGILHISGIVQKLQRIYFNIIFNIYFKMSGRKCFEPIDNV